MKSLICQRSQLLQLSVLCSTCATFAPISHNAAGASFVWSHVLNPSTIIDQFRVSLMVAIEAFYGLRHGSYFLIHDLTWYCLGILFVTQSWCYYGKYATAVTIIQTSWRQRLKEDTNRAYLAGNEHTVYYHNSGSLHDHTKNLSNVWYVYKTQDRDGGATKATTCRTDNAKLSFYSLWTIRSGIMPWPSSVFLCYRLCIPNSSI